MKPRVGPKLGKLLRPSQAKNTAEARATKAALAAKRVELRKLAKERRFWAVAHVRTLPMQTQKQINAAYKAARISKGTDLSYPRWCAELYREADDPSQYPGAIKLAVNLCPAHPAKPAVTQSAAP